MSDLLKRALEAGAQFGSKVEEDRNKFEKELIQALEEKVSCMAQKPGETQEEIMKLNRPKGVFYKLTLYDGSPITTYVMIDIGPYIDERYQMPFHEIVRELVIEVRKCYSERIMRK